MKKLLLVDGNNLVMRYAYSPGLDKMTNKKGEPTGGIHGAVKSILQDIDDLKPDEVAVVFDGLGASKKKREIYSGYKATRGPMLDSMFGQIETARNIFRAAGIFVFHEPTFDADDVIGALAHNYERSVLIKSHDKDFFQLTSPRVSIMRPKMDIWTWKRVRNEIVHPKRFAEYLALVGDSVDGIPGLHGCGPVMALKLLEEHKDWNSLFTRNDAIGVKLRAQKKELNQFLSLTRIDVKCLNAVKLKSIEKRLTPKAYDTKVLHQLLQSNSLRSLESWFQTHRGNVLSQKGTIFDAVRTIGGKS